MNTFNTCAVDLGNTSGRVMKALFDGKKIDLVEMNRFSNNTIPFSSFVKVDVMHLLHETITGILRSGDISSIGIDSWAIDFGLLGDDDDLILTPHHHRDPRTLKILEQFNDRAKQTPWYHSTGITFQAINTSLQLLSMARDHRSVLDHAHSFLMIPDLLVFFLTGIQANEATNASNTQLVSLKTQAWDWKIIHEIGVPERIFKNIVKPGTCLGTLRSTIKGYYNYTGDPSIIAVASHDTASAVHAAPCTDEHSVFISSGTWSLIGTVIEQPIISLEAMCRGYNNERAADGRIRFIKNTHGMWIVEELLRVWELHDGYKTSYQDIMEAVTHSKPHYAIVDINQNRSITHTIW